MKNGLYCIYDRKAQVTLPIFSSRTDVEATRIFTEAVMTSETPVSQYPADFDLIQVASYDVETGIVEAFVVPTPVINGLVALTDAQRQRHRYQSVLSTVAEEEPAPEAS